MATECLKSFMVGVVGVEELAAYLSEEIRKAIDQVGLKMIDAAEDGSIKEARLTPRLPLFVHLL